MTVNEISWFGKVNESHLSNAKGIIGVLNLFIGVLGWQIPIWRSKSAVPVYRSVVGVTEHSVVGTDIRDESHQLEIRFDEIRKYYISPRKLDIRTIAGIRYIIRLDGCSDEDLKELNGLISNGLENPTR